jgi:hypothetical protein
MMTRQYLEALNKATMAMEDFGITRHLIQNMLECEYSYKETTSR